MGKVVCTVCHTVGKRKSITKGSLLTEVLLWIFFILPGVAYSIWRLSTRYKACGECGSTEVVPINSPVGRDLTEKEVLTA